MIDRQSAGLLPAKPHTVCRAPDGKMLYEEMFTRGGFSGPFTYLYHRHPVTPHREVEVSTRGWPAPRAVEGPASPLRRRLYLSDRVPAGGMLVDRRLPVLFNRDVTVLLARPDASDDVYFANGDGDELWYLHEGHGRLESSCGWLDVKAGDYVWVPRSMIHRWHVAAPMRMLGFEAHGGVFVPDGFRNPVGQLRMDAPYTHRDFVHPVGPIATPDAVQEGPRDLLVKKAGTFTRYALENPAMDVVGWDGFVYPFAFAIEKFQPKVGLVHLPPTIHATFEGRGFLVCSFVPRVVDFHPQAIPCPYPHSSVDCDEVILYLRGNFTSRRGVGPGAISLHPAGVAHGPHPGAYEASVGTTRTDELAVMCDTFERLVPTAQAASLEEPGYHDSWKTT
ncbi:MAG TPA: homogentisate 1,2-dioxygenase [Polyangiaceae bacterium]